MPDPTRCGESERARERPTLEGVLECKVALALRVSEIIREACMKELEDVFLGRSFQRSLGKIS